MKGIAATPRALLCWMTGAADAKPPDEKAIAAQCNGPVVRISLGVLRFLNDLHEPGMSLLLTPGGEMHKAGHAGIRQNGVQRIPIRQSEVSQQEPFGLKQGHLLSRFLLVCFRSDEVRCYCNRTQVQRFFQGVPR